MSPDRRALLSVYSTLAEDHLSAQTQLGVIELLKTALSDRGADATARREVLALSEVLREHPDVTYLAYTETVALMAAAVRHGSGRTMRRRWPNAVGRRTR